MMTSTAAMCSLLLDRASFRSPQPFPHSSPGFGPESWELGRPQRAVSSGFPSRSPGTCLWSTVGVRTTGRRSARVGSQLGGRRRRNCR